MPSDQPSADSEVRATGSPDHSRVYLWTFDQAPAHIPVRTAGSAGEREAVAWYGLRVAPTALSATEYTYAVSPSDGAQRTLPIVGVNPKTREYHVPSAEGRRDARGSVVTSRVRSAALPEISRRSI